MRVSDEPKDRESFYVTRPGGEDAICQALLVNNIMASRVIVIALLHVYY